MVRATYSQYKGAQHLGLGHSLVIWTFILDSSSPGFFTWPSQQYKIARMKPNQKSCCCSGFYDVRFSRRHLLKVGGLGLLGLTVPKLLQAQTAKLAPRARAKSVIFLFQFGG